MCRQQQHKDHQKTETVWNTKLIMESMPDIVEYRIIKGYDQKCEQQKPFDLLNQ